MTTPHPVFGTPTLDDEEMKQLAELGERIGLGLSCDVNGMGVPCRSDRLQAVEDMVAYLRIHGYTVTEQV